MSILIFLLVLVVLILVHEFGHFIIAKRSGIRVDEFGIGFPPRLFGKKYGETLYSINAIPFGGFVKIFGEDREALEDTDRDLPRAMFNKSKWVQAAVLFGGVFFNILFAWLIFATTFAVGTAAVVTDKNEAFVRDVNLIVVEVVENSPAGSAGLLAEDIIVSLSASNETIIKGDSESVSQFIIEHGNENITLAYERGGVEDSVELTPVSGLLDRNDSPAIGVAMADIGKLKYPVHLALLESAKFTVSSFFAITVGIMGFLGSALLFSADLSQIAGPVGIVSLVGDASALGVIVLLNFTAFISLNLAVINLLPFPALDGGRLLFLGIEALKGSPISPHIARALNGIGFALLILLMLVVTYGDIFRIISN